MKYEFNFKCSAHNLRFAFDRPDNLVAEVLRCPLCAHERELRKDEVYRKVKEHRDALLRAIDLTQILQSQDEV